MPGSEDSGYLQAIADKQNEGEQLLGGERIVRFQRVKSNFLGWVGALSVFVLAGIAALYGHGQLVANVQHNREGTESLKVDVKQLKDDAKEHSKLITKVDTRQEDIVRALIRIEGKLDNQ